MSAAATALKRQKLQRIIITGAVTSVTIAGTLYGAGLKTTSEVTAKKEVVVEAAPVERIAVLEDRRSALVAVKMGLEKKIREVEARANGATRQESLEGRERKR